MGWTLVTGQESLSWRRRRVVGRADFPSSVGLSRKHFEIFESEGDVYLRDLNSTNGTKYNGQNIEPGQTIKIEAGDRFQAGDLVFQLEYSADSDRLFLIDAILLAVVAAFVFMEPSLKFGLAVGLWGMFLIWSGILLSLLPSALAMQWLLRDVLQLAFDIRTKLIYGVGVVALSLGLYQVEMGFADYRWRIGDDLIVAKVRYYCIHHFVQSECVRQVNLCPHCAQYFGRWNRQQIAEKLKAFRAQYPADAPVAQPRTPAGQAPANK